MSANIKKIFHIADIHCRLFHRHDEYRKVFDKLFEKIEKLGTEDSVIVLAGDIVHAKTDMSPELISLVSYLLQGCAKLCPTILIPGNHDFNENNPDRLDALTPIVEALNLDNLIYWKSSGELVLGDVLFTHFSLMRDESQEVYPQHVYDCVTTKVALYHGVVTGAETETGYSDFSNTKPLSNFNNFDITILGDIHKTQFLNARQTIAYCGSLIQQDHTEGSNRGFLVWDVPSRTARFEPIENEFGFVNVVVKNGKIVTDLNNAPKYAKVRMMHEGTDEADLKRISEDVKSKFEKCELRIEGDVKKRTTDQKVAVEDIVDTNNVNTQIRLIKEYLSEFGLDDGLLGAIEKIHMNLATQITKPEHIPNISWKPIKFTFSNMFSYGTNNVLDFSDINGIIGIFAPNATGKSTMLDALVYCIFDKCSRTNKAGLVLNNQSDEFKCEFDFSLGDSIFRIRRHGVKSSAGNVKVDVDFEQILEDGSVKNLNGMRRDDTNKIIRSYIGTYDDFILTTMSTQNDNRTFIDMTKKERQELLYRFLDIFVFVELFNLAKEESRDITTAIKLSEHANYYTQKKECEEKLYDTEAELQEIRQQMLECSGDIKKYTHDIETLLSQRASVEDVHDIDKLQSQHDLLTNEISKRKNRIPETTKFIENSKLESIEYNRLVETVDIEQYRLQLKNLYDEQNIYQSYETKLAGLRRDQKHLQSKVDVLATHEYDPNCEYCVKNQFVVDAREAEKLLVQINLDIKTYEDKLKGRDKLNLEIEDVQHKIRVYDQLVAKINELTIVIKTAESDLRDDMTGIESTEKDLKLCMERIDAYHRRSDIIHRNSEIDSKVSKLQICRIELETNLKSLQTHENNFISQISHYRSTIEQLTANIEQYETNKKTFEAYKYYMEAVNRNGVPYMILKRVLPLIESEVNEALAGMVDFSFGLSIADNDDIEGTIKYAEGTERAIELTSGMERFLLSVAIRNSLVRLSSLPKPNFIAIDEGFGVLDSDKLNSIYVLFQFLKKHFDFVVCISHIGSMRDYVDGLISIDKINGFSRLQLQ